MFHIKQADKIIDVNKDSIKRTMKRIIYFLGCLLYFTGAYNIVIKLRKNRKKILIYHDVEDNQNPFVDGLDITVRIKAFERQMEFLKKHYNVVKLEKLIKTIEENENSDRLVAITFDDGYESFYRNAFPNLKKKDFTATIFIIEKCLNNNYYMWRNRLCYLLNLNEKSTIAKFKKYFTQKNYLKMRTKRIFNKKLFLNLTAKLPEILSVKEIENILDTISEPEYGSKIKLYLDIEDCEKFSKNNFDFGNHSTSHLEFRYLNENDIKQQINWQQLDTVRNLNFRHDFLALPVGNPKGNNFKIEEIAKNNGITCMLYSNGLDNSLNTNLFKLGRCHLSSVEDYKIFTELELFPFFRNIRNEIKLN